VIVVSDTSPLTALITIGRADLLPLLFGRVIIPPTMKGEESSFSKNRLLSVSAP
jgi:predicted nucleic acid-binding protein